MIVLGGSPRQALRLVRFRRLVALNLTRSASTKGPGAAEVVRLYGFLEQYIVGQDRAKRVISTAVYNHYQRILRHGRAPPDSYQSEGGAAWSPSRNPHDATHRSISDKAAGKEKDASPASASDRYVPTLESTLASGGAGPSTVGVRPPTRRTKAGQELAQAQAEAREADPSRLALTSTFEADPTRNTIPVAGDPTLATGYFTPRIATTASAILDKVLKKRTSQSSLSASTRSQPDSDDPRPLRALPSYSQPPHLADPRPVSDVRRISDTDAASVVKGKILPAEAETHDAEESRTTGQQQNVEIEKSNVLMIGPTGTGKTLLTRTLARILDVPFASCDATTYTSAGYVGDDVENCVLRLLQAAEFDVSRAEMGIIHIDEIDKLARRGASDGFATWSGGRDVGGEGVQQAFLRLLEGTTVTVNAKPPAAPPPPPTPPPANMPGGKPEEPGWDPNNPMNRSFSGKRGVRDGLPGFGSGGGGGGGGKGETFVIDTSNILFICSGAFVGLEKLVSSRVGKGSIGFGATLPTPARSPDAPYAQSGASGASAERPQPLRNMSARDLQTYGLIPEFLGRLPIISVLHPLSTADLVRILTEPKNALVKQYQAIFESYGCELRFTRKALDAIAEEGAKRGGGARGLRGIMEEVLGEGMFEIPGSSVRYCLVMAATVKDKEPAVYFSRGQKYMFTNMAEEEDRDPAQVQLQEQEESEEPERMRASG